MSTPLYADIAYSVRDAIVASLSGAGSYGTPAAFAYLQDASYEPEHDTDKIKAGGAYREGLSVQIGTKISLKEAAMFDDVLNIIEGETATQSGSSGNRQRKRIHSGGGSGLPYFGIILVFEATDGAIFVYGAAKAQAESKQKFSAEQNKFRTGEIPIYAFATTTKEIEKTIKYESEDDLPDFTDAQEFEDFLTELWS